MRDRYVGIIDTQINTHVYLLYKRLKLYIYIYIYILTDIRYTWHILFMCIRSAHNDTLI